MRFAPGVERKPDLRIGILFCLMRLLSCGLLSAANSCGVGVASYVLRLVVASAWCAVFGCCVWPVLSIVGLAGGLLVDPLGVFVVALWLG